MKGSALERFAQEARIQLQKEVKARFNLIQKGEDMDTIPIILITHETGELAVRRAMDKIGQLEDVTEVNSVIRVGG